MSKLLDDLSAPGPTGPQHVPSRKPYPDGWQPRSEVDDTDGGFVVSRPSPAAVPQSHEEILAEFGLSSDDWSVERVRRSRWQKFDGEWLESMRLTLLPREAVADAKVDMEKLADDILAWRPSTGFQYLPGGDASFIHPHGDHQIGKLGSTGTEETIRRTLDEVNNHANRFVHLGSRVRFEQVVLPQLGDHSEGVASQGGALIKRTDLGLTEMVRVYRRLAWMFIKTFAAVAPKVLVPVIPGNHGIAVRINNQDASFGTDNWDVDAIAAVAERAGENPDLKDRVSFLFPEKEDLTLAFEASGTVFGMAHGHQFRGGWERWWAGQSAGRTPVGDADILLAGHLHHLVVQDHGGGRTFLQVPAMDPGSDWYSQQTGTASRSRAVSFWVADREIHDLDPIS